jgi:hypothetical protein
MPDGIPKFPIRLHDLELMNTENILHAEDEGDIFFEAFVFTYHDVTFQKILISLWGINRTPFTAKLSDFFKRTLY